MPALSVRSLALSVGLALALGAGGLAAPASAQVTAFKQAVAENAARDEDIAAYYRSTKFDHLWTGPDDRARLEALLTALSESDDHGLPAAKYDPDALMAKLADAKTPRERGALDVEISRVFLSYARDLQTGILTPAKVDGDIVRKVPYRDRVSYLENLAKSTPRAFFRALVPQHPEYARLMREKMRLEQMLGQGGWGPTVPGALKPGASGQAVVALRNRLAAMGYMGHSASASYDADLQKAVQLFQMDHGLEADGVAGAGTIAAINTPPEERLKSIIVAMERERWFNRERGARHILVNLTDFTARIVDHGKVTFETRSVIGHTDRDRRSPEFSDVMDHMVINPSWNVPRSITIKEYLPLLRRNPNAVGHLQVVDSRGRTVSRGAVNFSRYNARNFPYRLRQPPSRGNALGLVKFMFPNKYNIYLHDTPAKHLFSRETRAYSHGCIRLADPFEFAYALLAKQESDPKGFFQSKLRTGAETRVDLVDPVPVHLIYRTAYTTAKGRINYRRDIYGRDGRIFDALAREGVALRAVQG